MSTPEERLATRVGTVGAEQVRRDMTRTVTSRRFIGKDAEKPTTTTRQVLSRSNRKRIAQAEMDFNNRGNTQGELTAQVRGLGGGGGVQVEGQFGQGAITAGSVKPLGG